MRCIYPPWRIRNFGWHSSIQFLFVARGCCKVVNSLSLIVTACCTITIKFYIATILPVSLLVAPLHSIAHTNYVRLSSICSTVYKFLRQFIFKPILPPPFGATDISPPQTLLTKVAVFVVRHNYFFTQQSWIKFHTNPFFSHRSSLNFV